MTLKELRICRVGRSRTLWSRPRPVTWVNPLEHNSKLEDYLASPCSNAQALFAADAIGEEIVERPENRARRLEQIRISRARRIR